MNEYCGNCKWRRYWQGEWICSNPDSDYNGLETEYKDSCYDYEEKDI